MWFSILVLVLIALRPGVNVTAKYVETSAHSHEDRIVYDKYIELDKNLKKLVGYGVKIALPFIMEANEHLNLSSNCKMDVFQFISALKQLKLSALKFLDATGKIPSGLLEGTMQMLGDYDECMTTEVRRKDGSTDFKGQYCMVYVRPILPKKKKVMTVNSGLEELVEYTKNTSEAIQYFASIAQFFYDNPSKLGLCVPSGCGSEDLSMMLNYLGEKSFINATVEYCDQQNELQFYTSQIIAIFLLSVMGVLVIIGSALDHYCRKKEIIPQRGSTRLLLCFSALKNFPKAISAKISDKSLTSVFGVRSLSLFYIILMHHYYCMATVQVEGHMLQFLINSFRFFPQIAANGFLTTEVFFFVGGLVNTYTRMKIHESGNRKLNFMQILIHRLWRIYPIYIFTILASYLFVNTRGPMGTHLRQTYFDSCQKYWWQNILFINNFFVQEKTCLPHTWYIAADMQLFLISLFTVPVLLRNAKKGIILHLVILVGGLAATTLWAWYKDLMPAIILYRLDKDDIDRVWNAYSTATPHIAPYYTGLITGYLLSKWKNFKIPTIYQFLGWPVAAACLISMLFMTREWNSGKDFTLVESTLYFAFCRFLYVLAVAWLVVCCARGYGGIFNYILSLKVWVPMTRISYAVYLISPLLQMMYFGSSRMLLDVDPMTLIWQYIGDIGISSLLGLAMVVIIESPFISMEKLVFHRKSTTEKENYENNVKVRDENSKEENCSTEIELEKNNRNTIVNLQLKE